LPYLSPFQFGGSGGGLSSVSRGGGSKQCVLALISLSGLGYGLGNFCRGQGNHLMDVSEVPDLFSFLLSNGYKIDTSLTKMMNSNGIVGGVGGGGYGSNEVIAFITYNS
jgi:hypothetical protein